MLVSKKCSFSGKLLMPLVAASLVFLPGCGSHSYSYDDRPQPVDTYSEPPPSPDFAGTTNIDNLDTRFNQIMTWIRTLMQRGVNVDPILSKPEADQLREMVRAGNCRDACPKVDRIYYELERLIQENQGPSTPMTYSEPPPAINPPPAAFTPTTPENMQERFRKIMEWVNILLRQRQNVDAILPKPQADVLRAQVEAGNCRAACQEIDRVYRELEVMINGNNFRR